jgi:hypothetical protein
MRRALLVVPVLLLVAACGSDPSSLEGSGQALKDAGTSRVEWRMEGNLPDSEMFTATGTIDYVKERGEMVTKSKDHPKPFVRGIFIGHDAYMGVDYQGKMLWQKSSGEMATGADRLGPGPGGTRPDEVLDELVEASEKVEQVDREEIRGVTTTHYRAHIDEKKVAESKDLYPPEGLIIDAWIDEDGLMRRLRLPFGGPKDPVQVIDLYDFGVEVSIEPPPEDQVVSEDEFERLMEKECAKAAPDEASEANPICMFFGGVGSSPDELEAEEMSPTETIPER